MPVKRVRCLDFLRKKRIHFAILQEMHLKKQDVHRFQNKFYKILSFSCAPNKTKGVLLLADRKLNLHVDELGDDSDG